jgi:hypothetical protein
VPETVEAREHYPKKMLTIIVRGLFTNLVVCVDEFEDVAQDGKPWSTRYVRCAEADVKHGGNVS